MATPWKSRVPLAWSAKAFVVTGFGLWPSKVCILARGRFKEFSRLWRVFIYWRHSFVSLTFLPRETRASLCRGS